MALEPQILDSLQWPPQEALIGISIFDIGSGVHETLNRKHGGFTGHFVLLTDQYRKQLKERNIPFGTGYIETAGTLYKELKRGCTWVFTNHPLRINAFLN